MMNAVIRLTHGMPLSLVLAKTCGMYRVLDLARQLVSLLEAGVGEHDARAGDRAEQGLEPARHEACAAGREVAALELEEQHDDGQDRDGHLPPGDGAIDPGEQAHGQEVDRHEGEALDRRDRHRLHVGEEAEAETGHAAERHVREPGRPAGHRVHCAEFGVYQGQHGDHDAGDGPCQDRGAAHRLRGLQRTEKPSRADDRGLRRPGRPDQAHFSFQADVSRPFHDPSSFSHRRSFS